MSTSLTQLTPFSLLARPAQVWARKTAIVEGSRRLTYAEFGAQAERVRRAHRARRATR